MAKYNMEKNGAVFQNNIMPGDAPVIVIHEADWRELVEISRRGVFHSCDNLDCNALVAIIEKVEAANG